MKKLLAYFILALFMPVSIIATTGQENLVKIKKGEVASDTVVSISSPVIIEGRANKGVFIAGAPLTISGSVKGDIAVVGGSLTLKKGSTVSGNILLVGSKQHFENGASVKGKLFTTPLFGQQIRETLTDPASVFLRFNYDITFITTRFVFSIIWLVIAIILVKLFPNNVAFSCEKLKNDPSYTAVIGIVGVTLFFITLVTSLALCLILIGIPIFLLLLVFIISSWVFGMVVVFFSLGELILKFFKAKTISPILSLITGIAIWTILKLIPVVSLIVHLLAILFAIGITLNTRFGTGVPWFRSRRKTSSETIPTG